MQTKKKRTILYVILGVVAVAVAAGVTLIRSRQMAQAEVAIRSATVERGTMLVSVSASGSVEPQGRVDLAFEVPGLEEEIDELLHFPFSPRS